MTPKAMTPETLTEAAMIVVLQLRAIAEGSLADHGSSRAADLLRHPSLVEMVDLVTMVGIRGARGASQQLLELIAPIVAAGGGRAVLDDPDVSKAWVHAMRRLA